MLDAPLTREEVAAVIAGRGAARRVPMHIHFWVHTNEFKERKPAAEALLARYPMDAQLIEARTPAIFDAPPDDPHYRWVNFDDPYKNTNTALDARVAIKDWGQLEGILEDFPNPRYPALFAKNKPADGRYRLGIWWYGFFERHRSLRGMTNALTDYYTDPEKVHRLFRALTDFYLVVIERGKREANFDGIFTSDDLGHQTGPFFSPELFRTFFKPYYKELIDKAHSLGMQFWLHACGAIDKFLPDFVDLGLDVIHPLQKHTMDEKKIAAGFGGRICIWSGLDVQQVIPWGTPEEVRREVRHLIDTFNRPEGRLMLTAGNGINGDCSLASLEAFLDETLKYGARRRR